MLFILLYIILYYIVLFYIIVYYVIYYISIYIIILHIYIYVGVLIVFRCQARLPKRKEQHPGGVTY